ncbi:MAG TPA: hypothetical protein PKN00_13630 [Sedimentisphaerales bacterium]|nr:hypothetical protein [Sedimentisphaerales bacterium]
MDSRTSNDSPTCFVIMPISDPVGYDQGHFRKVFDKIFAPACGKIGVRPVRADDIKGTNLIHLDILQSLLSAPIAICDLSAWNPNVLYELGLRQAFDKPVVLVQQVGTPSIFDIAPLRYVEYRRDFRYDEVLDDQEKLAEVLRVTRDGHSAGTSVNSLVRILGLVHSATLPEATGPASTAYLELIRSEIEKLRGDIRSRTSHLQVGKDHEIDLAEIEQLNRQIMETHKVLDTGKGDWCGGRHESCFTLERMASNVDFLVNSCLPEEVRRLNDLAHGAKMKYMDILETEIRRLRSGAESKP